MNKADIDKVKESVDIAAFIGQFLELKKEGIHYKACCPFHDEKDGSFIVTPSKGIFKCFGCQAEGDVFEFYQKYKGVDFKEAFEVVSKFSGILPPPPKEEKDDFEIIYPIPSRKEPPGFFKDVQATHQFAYTDRTGNILGYACRFPDERFKCLYVFWVKYKSGKNAGKTKWKYARFPRPYPMFNLHRLAHSPQATVILVEGEKKAAILDKILNGALLVMAWPGGCNGGQYTDFSPLEGRKVIIWPDNDAPGIKVMNEIVGKIYHIVPGIRCVKNPPDKVKGWDCADAIEKDGWDKQNILDYIKANIYAPQAPPVPDKPAPPAPEQQTPPPPFKEDGSMPFQCLGYDHGICFFLTRGSRQVHSVKASDLKSNLLWLAPLVYWETHYAGRNGPDYQQAIDDLIRECEKKGIYNIHSVRGRGAWFDSGRSVLHFGSHLLVDGQKIPILNFKSKFIYEAGIEVEHNIGAPMNSDRSRDILRLLKMFNWKKPIQADLLAGWIVLAPICGAVPWRPHIWLTGGAGTGKTYTVKNIIEPMLGEFRLYVQGNTTEAGLRQNLKNDAMPILFDESEGEDKSAILRIKAVLDLMKQASTDTGGNIIKGSQSGRSILFQIRSMFCMSSIGLSIADEATRGRIAILELMEGPEKTKEEKRAHFEELHKKVAETITDEYSANLRARTIRLIPVIRENIKTFSKAAISVFKKQRTADQYGTLLAGTYALFSEQAATYDQAVRFVEAQDWEDVESADNDSIECLNTILQYTIYVGDSKKEKSIAECLEQVHDDIGGVGATKDEEDSLARHGVRLKDNIIWISDSHNALKKILGDTRWPKMWHRILRRLNGAITKKSMRFPGYPTAATGIPWESIFTPRDAIQEDLPF